MNGACEYNRGPARRLKSVSPINAVFESYTLRVIFYRGIMVAVWMSTVNNTALNKENPIGICRV